MYYIYILQSKINQEIYVGSTVDLKKRFTDHNAGKVLSTRRYKPWKLIYYEAFFEEKLARIREHNLKHNGNSIRELKRRIGLHKSGAGFTLIETLLYLGLLSIILTGSLTTAYYLLEGAQKLENKISNNEEINFILNTTEWLTNGVNVINSPLGGNSLSVNKVGFDKNPISLFQGAGKLYLKVGNDPALTLNTDKISVTAFTADHFSGSLGEGLSLNLEINGENLKIKKYLK